MNKIYKFAIVGGGPAGLLSFNTLKEKSFLDCEDIILFEKEKTTCFRLEFYGEFVKNYDSIGSKKWDFLVFGKYNGKRISSYFRKRYPGKYVFSGIRRISKKPKNKYYKLETESGEAYYSEKIVLATGVKPKGIEAIKKLTTRHFDCTNEHADELKKIAFENHEIIFVGSGDNVLFNANKLSRHIHKKYGELNHVPIIILVKKNLSPRANPLFKKQIADFVRNKLVKVVNNCWDLKKVLLNNSGLVSKIISSDAKYTVKAPGGAFLGVYIGYEANIPKLVGCKIDDFIVVGDLSLWLNHLPLSITDALQNVEEKLGSNLQGY